MHPFKVIAIVLIIAGVLGLAYKSFTYPKDRHEGKIGPIEFSVTENKTIDIPIWAGVVAITLGGVMLLIGKKNN